MKVAVRYMAQLKDAAGVASDELELGASCAVAEVLRLVADRHGGALRRLLLTADGRPQATILVFHGDAQVSGEQVLRLRDGDVLTVLAPMAGG